MTVADGPGHSSKNSLAPLPGSSAIPPTSSQSRAAARGIAQVAHPVTDSRARQPKRRRFAKCDHPTVRATIAVPKSAS